MAAPESLLKIEDFNYELPGELIAQAPLPIRDHCRLLVLKRSGGETYHKFFYNLPEFLNPGDVLVLNDARVMPWRIYGQTETGKQVEALLLMEIEKYSWRSLIKPSKKIREGAKIIWEDKIPSTVHRSSDGEGWIIHFEIENIHELLNKYGHAPLPPYIKRNRFHPLRKTDRIMYQTVFSSKAGAIAAPTASLHFTEKLIDELKNKGIQICYVTLLVGRGSFEPVRTWNVREHRMDAEMFEIKPEVADMINNAKARGNKIIACGTTVVRTLETSALKSGKVTPSAGFTSLFIYPGFNFKVVDILITNFHLPRSTPLILTSAFAGRELLLKTYEEAKRLKYRFLSYGDAMLIV